MSIPDIDKYHTANTPYSGPIALLRWNIRSDKT